MNDKYISLVAKYLSGEINDHEREELFGLINSSDEHRSYFEDLQTLWEVSGDEPEEALDINPELAWQKVVGRINPSNERPVTYSAPKIFQMGQLLKIAAVFIGVFLAIWLWKSNHGDPVQLLVFQTENNEKRELQLPDGSTVWMNENSTLEYHPDFEPRIVQLQGEAFFEVEALASSASFEIQSGETLTKVLGTSFNVRAYPAEPQVEVTVATGKVAFERKAVAKSAQKVLLTAGESGVYKKEVKDIVKQNQTISNADAWKKEKLVFQDAPLSEVVDVLKRYFDLEIIIENTDILNCPLTGEYPNPELKQLIMVLEFSLDLKVNQNEQTLTLSGAGCD